MSMKLLRTATQKDVPTIVNFLGQANLSTIGVEEAIGDFIIIEKENGEIAGTVGIERHGNNGLLRSLVLSQTFNQLQILELMEQTQQFAKKKELDKLYMFTNKQEFAQFFQLIGFYPQEIHTIPEEIKNSPYVMETFTLENCFVLACPLVK
ncbi:MULTISPECIES: GNAT family N-acetyltransferase [Bacillus]|uniref:GNAT family N-acetyltransferase n=1 Tax=Bacillus TaxID=1386 RepID=UPI000BB7A38C|nr:MULTISPECIES: hypothetical protein [Bacillus]